MCEIFIFQADFSPNLRRSDFLLKNFGHLCQFVPPPTTGSMDLETENRIAAILMKEAAELRRQADKEGVHVYLQQPQLRGRPNSRFLTATVLGVQQANRAVEVNEMWRVRQKELELDDRLRGRLREESRNDRSHKNITSSSRTISKRHSSTDKDVSASCSTNERESEDCYSRENGGLRDDEVEEFLQSRVKRGRGAVGSRMDETGPYLPRDSKEKLSTSPYISYKGEWEHRVLGPEKPSLLNAHESSEEDRDQDRRNKKAKKAHSRSLHEHDSRKHRYKKSRDKKKKRKDDKKCRHDK